MNICIRTAQARATLALLLCMSCWQAFGKTATEQDKQEAQNFYQVAISPDGSRLAWVQPAVDESGEAVGGSAIYVQDLRPSATKPKRISAANNTNGASESNVAWSPDGRQIAFFSDAASPEQPQLYVASLEGAATRKVTTLTGHLGSPAWSPDGKSVALLYTENPHSGGGPLMPMAPETGVIESEVYEQRLAMIDLSTGKVRRVSPSDMYVYEYDWSPDGKSFAVIAAPGEGNSNWYIAQLYSLDAASGDMKALYKPPLQIAGPKWSPDGKNVAFIAGLMSDEGSTGGDIFVVPATGGDARNVTPNIAASPSAIHWDSPDRILFAETIDGNSGLAVVSLADGKISQRWAGPEALQQNLWGATDISLSAHHENSAVVRQSSSMPPEVWAGPIGQWKQVTSVNRDLRPRWGEMKSVHWTSDGLRIQGWLLYPRDYVSSQRYPMVVVPHGGPAAAARPKWPSRFFDLNELSGHGYFVFYPNPRGSFGQGEAFTRANVKDFGYGDFRDIMTGVDEIVKTLPVDNDRIGITGWSYGGYMTMWAVTQTSRFHAAVVGAGLANFQSYYGQNDIDQWMVPYFGATVYDDPAVYARSSPINFVKNVRTPTLMLVGERDGECPAPQSREFWHALKTLGVETQLVIYAGEGHAIARTDHQQDIMDRLIGWFDKYLKGEQPAGKVAAAH